MTAYNQHVIDRELDRLRAAVEWVDTCRKCGGEVRGADAVLRWCPPCRRLHRA